VPVTDVLQVAGYGALGALAVALGVAVFVVDSMARATLALLGSFLVVAVLLWDLGLAYLSALVVLMMTLEMAVMAVYMIGFMMNPAGLMPMSMVHAGRASRAVAGVVLVLLVAGVWLVDWPVAQDPAPPADPTRQVGLAVMGPYMLTMITVGLALLSTMVAATVLATSRGRYDRFGDDLRRRRPDDPAPGGLPR
jgi:NADH-quinone oxidoreductase subunit J